MKLSLAEKLIVNSSARAVLQRRIEGPMLKKMGSREQYPLCLEIGCGNGNGARVIVEQFGAQKVIATDFDPEQIEKAARAVEPRLLEKIEFRVADAMSIPQPDAAFDAVFSIGVLHHLENWKKGVKEVARVLKSGGEFFFEEPLRPFVNNLLTRIFTPHPQGGAFDYRELEDELRLNAVDILHVRRICNIAVFGAGKKR